jgi:oligosaccharide repeat unit polymerase
LQYCSILLCTYIALFGYHKEKNIYNPLTFVFFIFALSIGLASLNLFSIFSTSQFTYFIIFTGLISFFIGYCFFYIINPSAKYNNITDKTNRYIFNIRYKLVYIFCVIAIGCLAYNALQTIKLLMQGYSLYIIRSDPYDLIDVPVIYSLFNAYIINPFIFALIPLGVVDYISGKRVLILPTIIIILLSMISSGGRFIVLYFLIFCIVSVLILKKQLNISKKIKRRIFIITLIGIIAIAVITNMRGVSSTLFEHLYNYIAGPIPHLDYRLNILQEQQVYTYGFTFLRGFLDPLFFILKSIGIVQGYPMIYFDSMNLSYVDDSVLIGIDTYFNAFVTPFFYFYLDGGILGIIICSSIYGFIFSLSYHYVKKAPNILNIAIYLLFIQGAITSMVRWQFIFPAYALAFIFLLFFLKKDIKKDILPSNSVLSQE